MTLPILLIAVSCLPILYKVKDIGVDMVWVKRRGRAYAEEAILRLSNNGHVSLDDLDRTFGRRHTIWMRLHRRGRVARLFGSFVYRMPAMLALVWLMMCFVGRPEHCAQAIVLCIVCPSVFLGMVSIVLHTFLERMYFARFDFLKRDWILQAANKYVVRRADLTSMRAMRGMLFYVVSLFLMIVIGYAAIFTALNLLDRRAFHLSPGHDIAWIQFIYFSAVTMGTVGFGDIVAMSPAAQLFVTGEILSGPFVLTLAIAVFSLDGPLETLVPREAPRRRRRRH